MRAVSFRDLYEKYIYFLCNSNVAYIRTGIISRRKVERSCQALLLPYIYMPATRLACTLVLALAVSLPHSHGILTHLPVRLSSSLAELGSARERAVSTPDGAESIYRPNKLQLRRGRSGGSTAANARSVSKRVEGFFSSRLG